MSSHTMATVGINMRHIYDRRLFPERNFSFLPSLFGLFESITEAHTCDDAITVAA